MANMCYVRLFHSCSAITRCVNVCMRSMEEWLASGGRADVKSRSAPLVLPKTEQASVLTLLVYHNTHHEMS